MKFPRLEIVSRQLEARIWSTVERVTFDLFRRDGTVERIVREVADHGHAAAVLPIDPERGTVLMVRQLRAAAFIAGHAEPLLEASAGLLDREVPEMCAIREAREELGCHIRNLSLVARVFSSPSALTENVSLFLAEYSKHDRAGSGGGLRHEGEDIEVVEISLQDLSQFVRNGTLIDAKTLILAMAAVSASPIRLR
jgi:nudix-type nucleoside diphosphatase (YffH/AdpP family)